MAFSYRQCETPTGPQWYVTDDTGHIFGSHESENAAQEHARQLSESDYLQHREAARNHPNRKDRNRSQLPPGATWGDVAGDIEDSIRRFKDTHGRR